MIIYSVRVEIKRATCLLQTRRHLTEISESKVWLMPWGEPPSVLAAVIDLKAMQYTLKPDPAKAA